MIWNYSKARYVPMTISFRLKNLRRADAFGYLLRR